MTPDTHAAAIDALHKLGDNSTLGDVERNSLETIVYTALANAPQVVTLEELLEENKNYLPFEGYKGMYDHCVENVRAALQRVAKKHPHGLIITAAPSVKIVGE